MTITETTTVAEIASALPSSVRVFQRHGIDFCCGGKTPIGVACEEQGIPFEQVASALEAAAVAGQAPDDRDWNQEPFSTLIDHIVSTYHDALREELPRLESMAARVSRVHGAKGPGLARLEALVTELAADLQAHMRKEEMVLFPAIRALELRREHANWIAQPIAVMEHEHDRAGALLSEMRSLTSDYAPPEWACQTFRALYHGLAELESTMHVHVHLENNVLFPRARARAAAE
jgi:regulator of cell morphogenesis and NO signaling